MKSVARILRSLAPRLAVLLLLAIVAASIAYTRSRDLPDISTVDAVRPVVGDVARIELLTYNVFVRPTPVSYGDETTCRSQRIGEWLNGESGADIVVLTETFHADDVQILSDAALQRFPHQVLSLPRAETIAGVSGGISVLSRWPIETITTEAFDECAGTLSDCLATKGAVHAAIRVSDDLLVNVVATHLDAGETDEDHEARRSQLADLTKFVRDNVDLRFPTYLLGDFNVNGFPGNRQEYRGLVETLTQITGRPPIDAVRATAPVWAAEGKLGQFLNTMNCGTTIWCDEDSPNFAAGAELRRRLDYVFALDDGRHRSRIVDAEHLELADAACGTRWLSDHKAVRATVELRRP